MSVIETAKAHPALTAGVVVVGAVILYMVFAGGGASASSPSAADASAVAAGTALQQAMIGSQTDAAHTAAALEASKDYNSTQITLADIAANYGSMGINAKVQEDTAIAALQAQTAQHISTLEAATQQAVVAADVRKTEIATNGAVQTTQLLAGVINNQTNAQAQTTQKALSCSGFFSSLFGC